MLELQWKCICGCQTNDRRRAADKCVRATKWHHFSLIFQDPPNECGTADSLMSVCVCVCEMGYL